MLPLVVIVLTILFLLVSLVILILKKDTQTFIRKSFILVLFAILIWEIGIFLRFTIGTIYSISIFYLCDVIVYIGVALVPVFMFQLSLSFINNKSRYTKKDILLFIVPIITIIIVFTNFHNLFYAYYSKDLIKFGPYMLYVHSLYSYGLIFLSLILLLRYSIKNAGFFSRASISIVLAIIIPVSLALTIDNTTSLYYYIIPSSFFLSVMLLMFALLRFNLLNITPIALQRIVDKISDGYVVLNDRMRISDHNKTFLNMFNTNYESIRNMDISKFFDKYIKDSQVHASKLTKSISSLKNSDKTIQYDLHIESLDKYFHIEINNIFSGTNVVGILVLFKDITQHIHDMEQIKDSQQILMEKDRLASLGQLIGGIAHNLKTPIMSISGASEGLRDLVKEYDTSIEDKEVTYADHHEIAKEMDEWIEKIKTHASYMSDVITAVKGQAVALSEQEVYSFTMDELVKRVDILMRHELKNALINMNVKISVPSKLEIKGNINSLIQVINNMISNSIQAYEGRTNENIDFNIEKEGTKIIISIKDYACGMPKNVQDKLLKEMITTKGKNGTGLGLFMSYSNIKAHFNGNIKFESKEGVGTTFYIYIPIE
ncbi:MAG: ATP-binding protein [Oscillospiraceae bacterium]|nr:ATP-binding protein [Oscillospiraceae bacterium]